MSLGLPRKICSFGKVPPPALPPPLPARKKSRSGLIIVTVVLLFGAFLTFRIIRAIDYGKKHPRTVIKAAGEPEFAAASRSIVSSAEGTVHGNNPEATGLATRMSEGMAILRKNLFEEGDAKKSILTKGSFLVFCQLDEDSCAFLIHVPELRHFTSSAQRSLAELAYVQACKILDDAGRDGIQRVAIATRGAMFYDTALMGKYLPKNPTPLAQIEEAKTEATTVPDLYPFFAAKPSIE